MKIAQGTIISTSTGNKLVERCVGEALLLSKYDADLKLGTTQIVQSVISLQPIEDVYTLLTVDGRTLETTKDCKFVCDSGEYELFSIPVDSSVLTVDGYVQVDKIASKREAECYSMSMTAAKTFVANGFVLVAQ